MMYSRYQVMLRVSLAQRPLRSEDDIELVLVRVLKGNAV